MKPKFLTFWQHVAVIVSIALVPPAVSAISFSLLSAFFEQGTVFHRFSVAFIAISFTGVIPMMYVLYLRRQRIVDEYDVRKREQRTNPYLMSVFYSAIGFFLLLFMRPSLILLALMWCYAVNTTLLLLINLKWKVSAHMMGLTGPATMLYFIFGWDVLWAAPAVLLLGWARVALRVHSIGQVVAGALAGALLTLAQVMIISQFGRNIFGPFVSAPFPFRF